MTMTAKTKWCILASIQFTEQFSPCVGSEYSSEFSGGSDTRS